MPRFKPIHRGLKMLPVDFDRQIAPGSFEHALCHLIDHELDLSDFHARYRNDVTGASAFDPAVLLKIVLLAYSRGITRSRRIEAACRESVLFMAVSGDSQPHFTTIAAFVAEMGELTAKLFAQVLTICDRQGLIGREMFAIDGVKLPSNASKARSGTRADFERQAAKMEKAAKLMLERHRAADACAQEPSEAEREARAVERLQKDAAQIRAWLREHPKDKKGAKGKIRQSSRTDNDSAKMATGKGVIQGYTGVATVDEQHQIIIDAQAHGTGSEQELLEGVIEAIGRHVGKTTVISADAGYHSKANCETLEAKRLIAYLPDAGYRKRDERYQGQERHREKKDPLHDKSPQPDKPQLFGPEDFTYDAEQQTCRCPAGKSLYRSGVGTTRQGYESSRFKGAVRDCGPCPLRAQCLRKPETTRVRQVAFFHRKAPAPETAVDRMRARIDSAAGRRMITRRFATVEPVFGNLRGNKRLSRFTLRGRHKVDAQWKLYCLVHNIEKLAHYG